jgi:hypothetical protein
MLSMLGASSMISRFPSPWGGALLVIVFNKFVDGHAWTPCATPLAANVLPRDQLSMPSPERIRRDEGGQFPEHALAQLIGLEG